MNIRNFAPASDTISILSREPLTYRPDIDALRAIAVLSVIGFHWKIPLFTGGFVGVDIFFVISGFLITKIVIDEIDQGTFSFQTFYERRCRRLAPALYAMIAGSFIICWLIQTPPDFKMFGLSIVSAITFSSNLLFWWQSGYLDEPSAEKPLLHTWSLAVEEQFYLFFPFALWALTLWLRSRKSPTGLGRFIGMGILGVGSFSLSWYWIGRASDANYYFGLTRGWEFLLGSALISAPKPPSDPIRKLALISSAALLCYPVLAFSEATRFPGPNALFPCLGAALFIWSGTSEQIRAPHSITRILATVGRVSYPMYLWHWPLYLGAMYALRQPQNLSILGAAVLMFLTVNLSWFSNRYIETPIRRKLILKTPKHLFMAVSIAGAALAAAGALVFVLNGIPSRMSDEMRAVTEYLNYDRRPVYREDVCFLNPEQRFADYDQHACFDLAADKPNVLLWGDSMAAHYYAAIARSEPDVHVLQANASSCGPVIGPAGNDTYCQPFNAAIIGLIIRHRPSAVIMSGNWYYLVRAFGHDRFLSLLGDTIKRVQSLGAKVVLFGPSIQYSEAGPRIIALNYKRKDTVPGLFDLDEDMAANFKDSEMLAYISVLTAVCPDRVCPLFAKRGVPMEWDTIHLTAEGSQYIIDRVKPELDRILRSKANESSPTLLRNR